MRWVICAFASAALIGLMDVFRKQSLRHNNVLQVLLLNVFFSALFLLPLIINAQFHLNWFSSPFLQLPQGDWAWHGLVLLKAFIVLLSWVFMFFALKHLPITLTAPINATYPILTLIGAMILFGEKLNCYQWIGIVISAGSLVLLSRTGHKEGIRFTHNKWIWLLAASALCSATSSLYDKFLLQRLHLLFVQSWYTLYQLILMGLGVAAVHYFKRTKQLPLHWSWCILGASICLSVSEFLYFYALQDSHALISVVSMIRRASVIVTFICGAFYFHEKNLSAKTRDLILIIIGMLFLGLGS